jgi:hypothetical protein
MLPTPLLDAIDTRGQMVTISKRLRDRANYTTQIPNGSEVLIKMSFGQQEIRNAVETFIRLGAQTQQWNTWYDTVLTDDCIYLPNDSKRCCISDEDRVWIGKDQIRKRLGYQLNLLPYAKYDRIDHYLIKDNQVIIYVNNDMVPHNTNDLYTIPNMTIMYYAGNGKFNFIEDFYNTREFETVVKRYLVTDMLHGGGAMFKFIKGLFM